MKLIVFDNRFNVRETYKGKYENGVFRYKENLFGKEKTLPITLDYNNLYSLPNEKEKVAFALYDGSNYKQIGLSESNIKTDIQAYIKDFQIAHYTKEAMLSKPQDLNDIIKWAMVLIALAVMVLAYFTSQNAYKTAQINYKALNGTLSAYTLQMKLQNYLLMKEFNITANLTQISKMPTTSIK